MAVTLQMIAEKAGVSRGTVDRALNNRGRINPEVANKIKRIAEEMEYQPNKAGRAMALAKKKLKIGVILQSSETPFMKEVLKGVEQAKQEIEGLGGRLYIIKIEGVNVKLVITAMELLKKKKYNAIVLMPSDDYQIRQTIDDYVEKYHIPIITFNVDLEDTRRICFVGQDTYKSGQTAAGLMAEIVDALGRVYVISGDANNKALNDRSRGFITEFKKIYPTSTIMGPRYIYDDDWEAEKAMEEILKQDGDVAGVYITGHGVYGVCKCLTKRGLGQKVKVIAHDLIDANVDYLRQGVINFLIDQDPMEQGLEPTMIAYRLIFEDKAPSKEQLYTDIIIKTKYNI